MDLSLTKPIKVLCIADQGDGKTCSPASLAAMGYDLFYLDCDGGFETLDNLLTDTTHYPYANIIQKSGRPLEDTTSVISISQEMEAGVIRKVDTDPNGKVLKTWEELGLKPKNAKAFAKVSEVLMNWKDNKGRSFGSVYTWKPNRILIIDTAATMARFGYYYSQSMNDRLGAPEVGHLHNQDLYGAQVWMRKISEILASDTVKCNVIMFSHIDWVDKTRGYAQSAQQRDRDHQPLNLTGVPEIIGKAFGQKVGKYFNNLFTIRYDNYDRVIWTVTKDKITCKRSGWLKDSYNQSTGMAEIFAQLNHIELPKGFLEELNPPASAPVIKPTPITPITQSPGIQKPKPLH